MYVMEVRRSTVTTHVHIPSSSNDYKHTYSQRWKMFYQRPTSNNDSGRERIYSVCEMQILCLELHVKGCNDARIWNKLRTHSRCSPAMILMIIMIANSQIEVMIVFITLGKRFAKLAVEWIERYHRSETRIRHAKFQRVSYCIFFLILLITVYVIYATWDWTP